MFNLRNCTVLGSIWSITRQYCLGHSARSNENSPIGLQDETGQPSGRISSGVDIDAVRTDVWFLGGCMAVNDNLSEILFVQQEFLADPKQIVFVLLT